VRGALSLACSRRSENEQTEQQLAVRGAVVDDQMAAISGVSWAGHGNGRRWSIAALMTPVTSGSGSG
jgi:hypothetical protein